MLLYRIESGKSNTTKRELYYISMLQRYGARSEANSSILYWLSKYSVLVSKESVYIFSDFNKILIDLFENISKESEKI